MASPDYIQSKQIPWWFCGLLGVSILMGSGSTAAGEVKVVGRVRHAGFPCGGRDCYRPGRWCPLVAELQNAGTEHVKGRLVLHQRDKDGDVVITETHLSLTAGGQPRTYRLDFIANQPGRMGTFAVRLLGEGDVPVPIYDPDGYRYDALPAPRVTPLDEEDTLVLDLSSRPISSLDALAADSGELLKRRMVVARFRPEDLPDRWYALQSLQAIIWDKPEVTRLDGQQMQALMDYVRAGGILTLCAGRTADEVGKSALGRILPATVRGTASVDVLQSIWDQLLEPPGWAGSPPVYGPPITVARAKAKPSATAFYREDAHQIDMVSRGRRGSGLVVFVAAELRDLYQQGGEKRRLFKELLGLLDAPPEQKDARTWRQESDLYDYMHGVIGFESVAGTFMVLVILFAAGYILVATVATWAWLRYRSGLQHCWTLFCLVALAGSVLTIAAVQVVRGVGTDVRQMSVVDAVLPADGRGPIEAQAISYFGLKTGTHTGLDVGLASTGNEDVTLPHRSYLCPLPTNQPGLTPGYVAPERYRLRTGQATMEGVPVRATLKRFQGHWFGELDGRFTAMIEATSRGKLSKYSWIRNDLGVDLHDCWLILSSTPRIGGLSREQQINVYQIVRTLRSGEGPMQIGGLQPENRAAWPRLEDLHKRWAGKFVRLRRPTWGGVREKPKFEMDKFPTALMLLTTMNEFDAYVSNERMEWDLRRSHGRQLDRCHLLTCDTALVVGFADAAGPVRLEVRPAGQPNARWQSIDPERGYVMYRFIVPVRVSAS